jgi:hypothetical protein
LPANLSYPVLATRGGGTAVGTAVGRATVATEVLVNTEIVCEEQPPRRSGIKPRRGSNLRTAVRIEVRTVLGKPYSSSESENKCSDFLAGPCSPHAVCAISHPKRTPFTAEGRPFLL